MDTHIEYTFIKPKPSILLCVDVSSKIVYWLTSWDFPLQNHSKVFCSVYGNNSQDINRGDSWINLWPLLDVLYWTHLWVLKLELKSVFGGPGISLIHITVHSLPTKSLHPFTYNLTQPAGHLFSWSHLTFVMHDLFGKLLLWNESNIFTRNASLAQTVWH